MKIAELISELNALAVLPVNPDTTCDTLKCGDANREITKVAVAMFATPDVIRKANEVGANFLIVHEPTYYCHMDNRIDHVIAKKKKALLDELDLTVYRYHDYAHSADPDLIYEGELDYLGIPGRRVKGDSFGVNRFLLDEPMTAVELAEAIENHLGLKNVRIAGCRDKKGTKVSCCFGAPGHLMEELTDNDYVLAGEICEWADGQLAKDYAQFGFNKAMIVMGHIGSERDGMKLLAEKITAAHPEFETVYLECGELYTYTK